jgi:hypothetical protein
MAAGAHVSCVAGLRCDPEMPLCELRRRWTATTSRPAAGWGCSVRRLHPFKSIDGTGRCWEPPRIGASTAGDVDQISELGLGDGFSGIEQIENAADDVQVVLGQLVVAVGIGDDQESEQVGRLDHVRGPMKVQTPIAVCGAERLSGRRYSGRRSCCHATFPGRRENSSLIPFLFYIFRRKS